MFPASTIPFLAVVVWIVLAGYGIWSFAAQETEPPVYDVLTYAQKAYNFWDAVTQGHLFNPMNLEPTSRPFGTVLMSYPFGFSQDFRGFYFRSMFIPLVLLAAASLCAVPCKHLSSKQRCLLCAAAIVLASAPALFQFRYDAQFPIVGSWGIVDNFLAGMTTFAFCVLLRGNREHMGYTALIVSLLGAFCFLIKPAGLMVMFLLAASWIVFSLQSYRSKQCSVRDLASGLLIFFVVYGCFVAWAFSSAYLSADNVASAKRAFTILKIESVPFDFIGMLEMMRVGIGIPVMIMWFAGFLCALRRQWRSHALASFMILLAGGFFWLAEAHFSQVRYFLPFAFAATIVTLPALIDAARDWSPAHTTALIIVLLTPSIGIGSMLMSDNPPARLQTLLGINLTVNKYASEVSQAKSLLFYMAEKLGGASPVYFASLANPVMAFQAVIDSSHWYHPAKLKTSSFLPINWAGGSAFRMDELSSSRFIVFEPVRLHASELSDRADRDILTFKQEGRVVIDWLSLLSENDGIRILSETSVRVIEVTNRNRFESAIERLVGSYRWRPLFLSGYGERWLKAADISAERWDNLLKKPLQMRSPDGTPAAELLGIFIHETPPEVIVDIWLKPLKYLTVSEGSPWFVFFHGLSAEAQIQQAPQSIYIDPAEGKSVRQYRFRLPFLPFSGAIGVYRPGADAFLVSESKDWDGRRVQFSMRETANIGAFVR